MNMRWAMLWSAIYGLTIAAAACTLFVMHAVRGDALTTARTVHARIRY